MMCGLFCEMYSTVVPPVVVPPNEALLLARESQQKSVAANTRWVVSFRAIETHADRDSVLPASDKTWRWAIDNKFKRLRPHLAGYIPYLTAWGIILYQINSPWRQGEFVSARDCILLLRLGLS